MVFSTSASAHPLFSSDPSNWNQQPPHAQDQAAGSNTAHHFSGATTNSENTYNIGIQLPLPAAAPDHHFALASSSTEGLLIPPNIPTDPIIITPLINKAPNPISEPDLGGLKCPRCDSTNTKFCYFNNYSLSQPRHFCRSCRRYWTRGGTLRNVPVGGGSRRNAKHGKLNATNSKPARASGKALSNTTRKIGAISSLNYNLTASTNVRSGLVAEMPMQLMKQPDRFPFNIIGSSESSHPMAVNNGHLGINSRYDELLCGSNGTAGGGVVNGSGSNNNNSEFQSGLPGSMNYSSSHGNIFP